MNNIPRGNGFFVALFALNIILESLEKIDRIHGIVLPGHDEGVFNRSTIYPPK